MILKRKSQRLLLVIVLSTLSASVISAIVSVQYMQERFYKYDNAVFERLVEESKDKDVKSLFEDITNIINERDIVIAVNYSGDVIKSEGLVVGEKFEDQINSEVKFDGNRIILDRNQFELNTYIQDVNVSLDKVFTFGIDDNVRGYYVPFRLVREQDYLMNILKALSLGCFVVCFAMTLINKDIKEMIEEEKRILEYDKGDR